MKKITKSKYIRPELELVKTPAFNLMLPHSWNPDYNEPDPYSPDLPIIEGDPEGNGKEANGYSLFDFDDIVGHSGGHGNDPWDNL